MRSIRCLALAILLCASLQQRAEAQEAPAQAALPKPATAATKERNAAVLKELPFQNREDFAEAQRGLIAKIDLPVIRGDSPLPIWDLTAYTRFVNLDTPAPDTVNPSLWRQLQLLTIAGLFQVTDRVYQVRGYDLSNVSIIEGDTGLLIIDPLISEETARASLDLYYRHRPRKPVVAVIFTHSHVDHYAGVAGIVTPEDLAAGRVKIIAPDNFLEEAVSENVIAGNAMGRRATYMYGAFLPKGPKGQTSAGLGLTNSLGTKSLLDPTDSITQTGQEMTVDGVRIRFQLTPNTEAPAEMNFYFPDLKALCMAENMAATFHNVLTLRGAKVRDPLQWSKYLQQAIDLFAGEAEVVFTSHHWPKWGQAQILNYMSKQRDLYKYINDQASRLFNQGYTILELAEMIKLPESLAQEWFNRGYYGTVNHNAKAVYQRYLGWFDGNPAHLHTYPPAEGGKRYVEAMGGADAVLAKAAEAFKQGDYRWVAELVSHVVFADPDNRQARLLEADALEQLGYQAESGPWRNFFLMGAQELRVGVFKPGGESGGVSTEVVESMDVDLLLDYVAIHLNGPRAAGKIGRYDFVFTDVEQTWRVNLENAVLQYSPARPGAAAEATLTLTRATLNDVIGGKVTYDQAVKSGAIQVSGNQAAAAELFSLLDLFDPWFNIVTP
ncbi:MAG TPA: alkyl sulfatase dimerization domain-containing protein [Thermoanaerobaculia bacterium]|nr:alkyl sulfatase dimerization domain-containing protein [Thermoanaerobaculia bacterium]